MPLDSGIAPTPPHILAEWQICSICTKREQDENERTTGRQDDSFARHLVKFKLICGGRNVSGPAMCARALALCTTSLDTAQKNKEGA